MISKMYKNNAYGLFIYLFFGCSNIKNSFRRLIFRRVCKKEKAVAIINELKLFDLILFVCAIRLISIYREKVLSYFCYLLK